MAITASMVKELREKTGAGMMDCKKALTEADGDMEAAIKHLREKSLATATKKAGRIAAEGLIGIEVKGDVAAIIELNCETDFVARNDAFQKLTADLAAHTCATDVADLDALLASEMDGKSVTDTLTAAVSSIGEKISLRRFQRLSGGAAYGSYSHGGGSIGVVVQLGLADASKASNESVSMLAKDIAMHIASEAPLARTSDEVDAATIENEREIYKNQALAEGKPENIVDKIVDGRIKKFLKESVLVEQQFIKDPDLTIAKLIDKLSKELGTEITVDAFVRFQVGEGIEKKQDNLADEVAKMTK